MPLEDQIMNWFKKEFPSTRGTHKLFTLNAPVILPTGEKALFAIVVECSLLLEENLSRAADILFSTGLQSRSELCKYKITLSADDGRTLSDFSQGIRTLDEQDTESTRYEHFSTEEKWKFDGALDDNKDVLEALMAVNGELIKLPHPLLPDAKRGIKICYE